MAIRLKSPDWRIYTVERRADLELYGRLYVALNLHAELAKNLRQLCGFDVVGTDRGGRKTASGWHLVDHPTLKEHLVQWVTHAEKGVIVPVAGSATDKLKLIQAYEPAIKSGEFKKLLNNDRKTPVDGWSKLDEMPNAVTTLKDGELLQVSSKPSAQLMPRPHEMCSRSHCFSGDRHTYRQRAATGSATAAAAAAAADVAADVATAAPRRRRHLRHRPHLRRRRLPRPGLRRLRHLRPRHTSCQHAAAAVAAAAAAAAAAPRRPRPRRARLRRPCLCRPRLCRPQLRRPRLRLPKGTHAAPLCPARSQLRTPHPFAPRGASFPLRLMQVHTLHGMDRRFGAWFSVLGHRVAEDMDG